MGLSSNFFSLAVSLYGGLVTIAEPAVVLHLASFFDRLTIVLF